MGNSLYNLPHEVILLGFVETDFLFIIDMHFPVQHGQSQDTDGTFKTSGEHGVQQLTGSGEPSDHVTIGEQHRLHKY